MDTEKHSLTAIYVEVFLNNIYIICKIIIIPALSKESSGILLLPLSVRPSIRPKEKFVTGTPSTF